MQFRILLFIIWTSNCEWVLNNCALFTHKELSRSREGVVSGMKDELVREED